jgi:tetratricopeptide (TPR) repeat protein
MAIAGASPADLLAEGDALYDRWQGEFEFVAYEARLRGAIGKWEQAFAALPAGEIELRRRVLVSLARAYFELADAYLGEGDRRTVYAQGEAAARAALQLEPEFVRVEAARGFRAALGAASDVGAIFWYGNNLGMLLSYDWGRAVLGGTRDVLAAFTRAAELDEAYWGGGPHRALANFFAQTPGFFGGDLARAAVHFRRAIELDPAFIQNYVDQAEYHAKPRREWDVFCSLLRAALDRGADPVAVARWPLYNHLALARARRLAAEVPGRYP